MTPLRTILINPPAPAPYGQGAGARHHTDHGASGVWYPTWLAASAALIPGAKLLDASAEGLSAAETALLCKGFDLIVLHASSWSFSRDAETARSLREACPRALIGFVGPHAAALPAAALQNCPAADFAARQEFDHALLELAQGRPPADVLGISYRDGSRIRHNRTRPSIKDLDSLPDPLDVYRRDLQVSHYSVGYLRHPFLTLTTGRGCPESCSFCLWPQTVGGRPYRARSVERVLADAAKAKRLFPEVREIFFDDDTFTADLPRALSIAEGLGKLGLAWSCNARPDVPAAALRDMRKNGLRLLSVGYESGSAAVLERAKKGIDTRRARQFTSECRAAGVRVHGSFILGLPGETRRTIAETISYACALDVDSMHVSLAAAYPGTEFYREARDNGWLSAAGIAYDGLDGEDLVRAMFRMYSRFYLRPTALWRTAKAVWHDPRQRAHRARAAREFARFLWNGPDPLAQVFHAPEAPSERGEALDAQPA